MPAPKNPDSSITTVVLSSRLTFTQPARIKAYSSAGLAPMDLGSKTIPADPVDRSIPADSGSRVAPVERESRAILEDSNSKTPGVSSGNRL